MLGSAAVHHLCCTAGQTSIEQISLLITWQSMPTQKCMVCCGMCGMCRVNKVTSGLNLSTVLGCCTPDAASLVVDSDQVLAHHIELLQRVGVLRVCDVTNVLQSAHASGQ